jgi:hypothetical protein
MNTCKKLRQLNYISAKIVAFVALSLLALVAGRFLGFSRHSNPFHAL